MKKYIYYFIAAALLSSCSSDFLEETPKGNMTTGSYYKTSQQAVSATNAIYDYIISGYSPNGLWDENFGGLFYNYYWVLQDLASDNAGSNNTSNDFKSIDNLEIDKYNKPLEILWRDFYQTVKCCNVVIDKIPGVEMDETLKNQLLSEARFFRGMVYFDLVRMFGDVPLRLHDMTGASDEQMPRTPAIQIYAQIFEDLQFAEKNMNYAARQGGGRPYALSATALLARVYNTYATETGDKSYYQRAIDCAQRVIPSFPMMSNFADLYKIANRFNSEIIYGVNFNTSLSEGWKGGQFLVRLLPNMDTGKGGPNNAQGWEYCTDNLYDSYDANDLRKDVTVKKRFTYNDGSVETLPKAYFFKYWDQSAEPKGNNSDAIFPAIRTAEMYLIVAEASNELHSAPTAEAKNALKAVRTRAGLGNNPIPTSYTDFKKAVLDEYRHEFAMEGHRWFDLKRMLAPQEFVNVIKTAKSSSKPRVENRYFPIPQREINLSNGQLTQNDGY